MSLGSADSVLYSADGERLAVRSSQLSVWDLQKQARLWRANPVPYLNYAAFSPDATRLAVKSTTGQIAVVDAKNGKQVADFRNKKDGEGCNLLFSPCGDYVVDGTWEGRLLVRAANGKIEFEQEFPNEMIHDLYAVDSGSKWIVMHNPTPAGDDDEPPPPYFSIWKWPFGKTPLHTIQLQEQGYFTTALSPDGKFFAFDSHLVPKKPSIDILSLENGKPVTSIARAREDRLEKLSWSADGKWLGVVKENSVVVYDTGNWQPVAEREVADANDIAFSPAGDTIAIGARKAMVIAWNDLIPSAGEAPKIVSKPKKTSPVAETSYIFAPEHQKAFKKVLAALPAKSKIRAFLAELASDDEDRRVAAYERLCEFDKSKPSEDVRSPKWQLKEDEAVAILFAGTIAEFPPPPPDADWQDGYHTALTLLWRSPHPSLLPLVGLAYEKQPHGLRRAGLLALLAILGTREAAETFAACIRRYGWPPTYVRVWDELGKLLAHGDVLLPDIALAANKDQIGSLCDTITYALADGTLKLEQVAGRLDALAPVTVATIKKLLKQTSKYQTRKGIEWRFGDAYSDARYRLSSLLTLAGYLMDAKLPPLVSEAAKFTDPLIAMAAAVAMLRQTGDISKSALRRAAQSHETRASLYAALADMKRTDLFPKEFATWEAFAVCAMVEWLKYPTELGREPDMIELGHTEWVDKRRKLAMFVWKFRNTNESWLAGVSGPHELKGTPRPTHGSMTFSQFAEWDSATPQEHLKRCAATVEQICE